MSFAHPAHDVGIVDIELLNFCRELVMIRALALLERRTL